ncbi:MAG: nucleotidyltransferase domain-containing protein [Lachnospiraceae bacterium]|nr:nucleotidyltransferase domain-containing protein [Lachnospiraceae bacterium]
MIQKGELMAGKDYSIDELREVVSPIARKYRVSRVYLFGSFARGDYNDESDIDLRIDKGAMQGMFALCGFYSDLSDALDRKVDVLTTGSLEESFLQRIKKLEAPPRYARRQDAPSIERNASRLDGADEVILYAD